jgi:energy-coupling factor transporter ATP-binding protein EcfA2
MRWVWEFCVSGMSELLNLVFMLQRIHIQNYAIIDELSIDFSARMNVITGETGAGKSILMGALSLILGDRADTAVLAWKAIEMCGGGGVCGMVREKRGAGFFQGERPGCGGRGSDPAGDSAEREVEGFCERYAGEPGAIKETGHDAGGSAPAV